MPDEEEAPEKTSEESPEDPTAKGKLALAAVLVGAAMLVAVMGLMLLAVKQAPPAVAVNKGPDFAKMSPLEYARDYLSIEKEVTNLRINVIGARELVIEGIVKNKGKLSVASANMKCYFRSDSGNETSIVFPLIVESGLDDIGNGPLPPMSQKEFKVRNGDFPFNLEPDVIRNEIINLKLEKR